MRRSAAGPAARTRARRWRRCSRARAAAPAQDERQRQRAPSVSVSERQDACGAKRAVVPRALRQRRRVRPQSPAWRVTALCAVCCAPWAAEGRGVSCRRRDAPRNSPPSASVRAGVHQQPHAWLRPLRAESRLPLRHRAHQDCCSRDSKRGAARRARRGARARRHGCGDGSCAALYAPAAVSRTAQAC